MNNVILKETSCGGVERTGGTPDQLLADLARIAGAAERPMCLTAYDYQTGRSFTMTPEGYPFAAGHETIYIVREETETTVTKIKKIFRRAFYL